MGCVRCEGCFKCRRQICNLKLFNTTIKKGRACTVQRRKMNNDSPLTRALIYGYLVNGQLTGSKSAKKKNG